MDRAVELRLVYDTLKVELGKAEGSAVAAIGRELRILSAELEMLEAPSGAKPKVDELAEQRAKSDARRPPARRRQSG